MSLIEVKGWSLTAHWSQKAQMLALSRAVARVHVTRAVQNRFDLSLHKRPRIL